MYDRLIAELQRLYLQPGQRCYPQPGAAVQPLTPLLLQRQLSGELTLAVAEEDRVRLLAIAFQGVLHGRGGEHWERIKQLYNAVQEELGLPTPALSVSGRTGYGFWLALSEPLPGAQAGAFLQRLRQVYLGDIPSEELVLWPGGDTAGQPLRTLELPPCLHRANGKWAAFIKPEMGGVFSDSPGLEFPPNPDAQADLLAALEVISPAAWQRSLTALRQRAVAQRPAQSPDAPSSEGLPEATQAPGLAETAGPLEEPLWPEIGDGPLIDFRAALFGRILRTEIRAVPAPFAGLTQRLHGGFRGGWLYLLLAPAGSGKTTLAAQCLEYAAANGYPSLYLSYALAREQLVIYALARQLALDARKIETHALSAEEAEQVAARLEAYLDREGRYLEIREAAPSAAIAEAGAWVAQARAAYPDRTPLIAVDCLQLANSGFGELDRHPSRLRRIVAVAAACKELARRTEAAVLALAGSRALEPRAVGGDSPAVWLAADAVLTLSTPSLQAATGPSGNQTAPDPWAYAVEQARAQGREEEALTLEWTLRRLVQEYPEGGPDRARRARLSLAQRGGVSGHVALYYRQAQHAMQEVVLPDLEVIGQRSESGLAAPDQPENPRT